MNPESRVEVSSARPRRSPTHRRGRVELSMGRGAAAGIGAALVVVVVLVFAAGFVAGQRAAPLVKVAGPAPVSIVVAAPAAAVTPRRRRVEAERAVRGAVARPMPRVADTPPPEDPTVDVATADTVAGTAPLQLRRDPAVGHHGVQLGAFESLEDAATFVAEHRDALADQPLYVVTVKIPGRGTWHRIRVGAVRTRRQAKAIKKRLPASLGSKALVVTYR